MNLAVAQIIKIGDQPVQLFAGVRYYLDTPSGGPDWDPRFGFNFLFPKS